MIKKAGYLIAIFLCSVIVQLVTSDKAEAAKLNCKDTIVEMEDGDYCEFTSPGGVHFGGEALTESGGWEVSYNGDHKNPVSEGSWHTEGDNVGCYHGNAAGVWRITITSGDARIKGTINTPVCSFGGGDPPPPPPPAEAKGKLKCVVLSDTSIRWDATWKNAPKIVALMKGGSTIYKFKGNGPKKNDSKSWPQTGLAPGTKYQYRLKHAPSGSNKTLGSAACTTTGGPGPRIPAFTTKFNTPTYGDIHAGGLTQLSKGAVTCESSTPAAGIVSGGTSQSLVSSAASSAGQILGLGSGGIPALRNYLLGNVPGGGYSWPICRPNVRSQMYAFYPPGRPKGGAHRIVKSFGSKRIVYFGDRNGHNNDSCRNSDVGSATEPRTIAWYLSNDIDPATNLPSTDPNLEVLIWCDVRFQRKYIYGSASSPGGHPGCGLPSCTGRERKNRRIRINTPITIKGRKTLFVETWTRLTWHGCTPKSSSCTSGSFTDPRQKTSLYQNIFFDTTPVTDPRDLPSFALITDGNIYIGNGVENLFGYFFAGALHDPKPSKPRSYGIITTCNVVPQKKASSTSACNRRLTINGMISGKRIYLYRTGDGITAEGHMTAERVGGPGFGQMFIGSPPPGLKFGGAESPSIDAQNYYEGERPPIF